MGIYINKGNEGFQSTRNSEYIDMSGLIAVSTPRCLHGNALAASLVAGALGNQWRLRYYDYSCDSRSLFANLEIARHPSFEEHLNKYPVIYLDMTRFTSGNDGFCGGGYMTGILPIKKYKTQSALNNFLEYSMVELGNMGKYFGFTKDEVLVLSTNHKVDFDELEKWYDGYQIGDEMSMFNPNSVIQAVCRGRCRSYCFNRFL